jgi:translation elongation factor EF-1alpha
MDRIDATFDVQDVFHITGRSDTYVAGKIKDGIVRAGMSAKVPVAGGAFMVAKIKSIESVRDLSGRSNVALALDTPKEEVRGLWKDLCRRGDILTLQP